VAFSEGNLADHLGGLGYSEEQIELMDVATNFCRDKSPIDKVRKLIEDDHGYDPAVWRQEIVDLGWLGIAVPEAQGGVRAVDGRGRADRRADGAAAARHAVRDLHHRCAGAAGGGHRGAVRRMAAADRRGRGGDAGAHRAAWRLEPCPCRKRPPRPGGSGYVLSGTKQFVAYARDAALIIATVQIGGAARLALIERAQIADTAMRREIIIDETKRSYELTLDGIEIGPDAVLDAGRTANALMQIELASALLQAAEMCGGTQSAIDYTIEYLKTRKQFGKVIGEYQALKHPITNAYVAYEKARSHMLSAAHNFGQQGVGEIAVRMAKASADKAYSFAADRAVQFHGGFGFTHDCDAGLYRRSAIWHASQYGDAAWHRSKLADLLF
jgi:acyl-CoA dehydrogenase